MAKKVRKKSEFAQSLEVGMKKYRDMNLDPEKRKEERYAKLERIFNDFGDKKNRYLFYCPDIPFACTLLKTVYEHVHILKSLGYNAEVIHEVKGFKPSFMKEEYMKDVKINYLQERDKVGNLSKPNFNFMPTDSVVIPEGFWTVMTGFANTKTLHKIVLVTGYGGFQTAEPGANWAMLGFTDAICISEQLKQDYETLWPGLTYHFSGYSLDKEALAPIPKIEITPTIAISCRSREDAQAIINIFYSKYPFLDIFQFKVLKKLDTENYNDTIKRCAALVFVDEKAGHPAPPLEAVAAGIPTIAVYGRGMEHMAEQQGIIWLPTNDLFILVETLAEFCINWLENNIAPITDKAILDKYDKDVVRTRLLGVMTQLQVHKVKQFSAIKTAVDDGKLDETILDDLTNPLEDRGPVQKEETNLIIAK